MKTLKPLGHYVEAVPLGASKPVKHWQCDNGDKLYIGQVIRRKGVAMDVKDITPEGLAIEYRKATDEGC